MASPKRIVMRVDRLLFLLELLLDFEHARSGNPPPRIQVLRERYELDDGFFAGWRRLRGETSFWYDSAYQQSIDRFLQLNREQLRMLELDVTNVVGTPEQWFQEEVGQSQYANAYRRIVEDIATGKLTEADCGRDA